MGGICCSRVGAGRGSRGVGEEEVADSYGSEGGKEKKRWDREGLLLIRHGFRVWTEGSD